MHRERTADTGEPWVSVAGTGQNTPLRCMPQMGRLSPGTLSSRSVPVRTSISSTDHHGAVSHAITTGYGPIISAHRGSGAGSIESRGACPFVTTTEQGAH